MSNPKTIWVRDFAERIGRHHTGVLRRLKNLDICLYSASMPSGQWAMFITLDGARRYLEVTGLDRYHRI